MLQYGTHITQADDPLKKVTPERIFQGIISPKENMRVQIDRLRRVRAMDPRQYAKLKKNLPYFVCGLFHPPIRRKDHFSAIQFFMVDLDHFSEADLDLNSVFHKIQEDEHLVMAFRSPGGDGLKLMFQLSENCLDAGLYSMFYKAFIQKLTARHGLEKVIDSRTHDVTRACFLSVDEQAFFNKEAQPVVLSDYFSGNSPDETREILKGQKKLVDSAPPRPKKDTVSDPLTDKVLEDIRKKLNPNYRARPKKEVFVPKQLSEVMDDVREQLATMDMELQEEENIQYGKKLRVKAGNHWAEINIFFGKRGYSVVKTTRSGSHPELATLAHQVLCELLIPQEKDLGSSEES